MVATAEKLPQPIKMLCNEHRYMSLLLETMLEQLQEDGLDSAASYYLVQDIARYMHEYPDVIHHPTEDILFERLLLRDPEVKQDVDWLRRDHLRLESNTAEIIELLDVAATKQSAEAKDAASQAVKHYIERLQEHIVLEESKLFPMAVQCLSHTDWKMIGDRLEEVDDPLFGQTVERDYRPLYEYFSRRADILSRGLTGYEFRQFDNFVVSADAFERGISEMWELISNHASACFDKTRSAVKEISADLNPFSVLGVQLRFAKEIGTQNINFGIDAVSISVKTARRMIAPFFDSNTAEGDDIAS